MEHKVSSFYKYVEVDDPHNLKAEIFSLCESLGIKGRVLVGKEGLNGSIWGETNNVEEFKKKLKEKNIFKDLEFKEQWSEKPAFSRLYVSVKKEVVFSGLNTDLKNTARFITPKELKSMLDGKQDITLVDMRNNYETKIGKFRNARTIDIKNFRDLPNMIDEISDLKNKKVVAYCTGGIRCEKASAFLRKIGFENVSQLKGGILKFGEEFPDTYWEGRCFVFDNRVSIELNRDKEESLECELCGNSAGNYLNCHNIECDKLYICCDECMVKFNTSCSKECSNNPKRRKKNTVEILS